MTDFAKGNYDELEPFEMGSFQGVFARSALGSEQVGVSRFRYAPNHASAAGHRHAVQEEVYVVVSGSGRMRLDDEVVDVRPSSSSSPAAPGRRTATASWSPIDGPAPRAAAPSGRGTPPARGARARARDLTA